jgi:hypothetical protein
VPANAKAAAPVSNAILMVGSPCLRKSPIAVW